MFRFKFSDWFFFRRKAFEKKKIGFLAIYHPLTRMIQACSLRVANARSFSYALSVLMKQYEKDTLGVVIKTLVADNDPRYASHFKTFRFRKDIVILTSYNEYHNP